MPYPEVVKVWWMIGSLVGCAVFLLWIQRDQMDLAEQVGHLPTGDGIFLLIEGPVVKQIAGQAGGEEAEYKEFVEKTGFDFRRDLDRLVAVIGEPDSYYIATGRFDWAKISAYVGNCAKGVCSMAASQPGKWISLMKLPNGAIAIAVSPNQLAVGKTEAVRKPVVAYQDAPFLMRGKGRHFARWGLSGEQMVEARLSQEALVLQAGSVTRTIPLKKIFE